MQLHDGVHLRPLRRPGHLLTGSQLLDPSTAVDYCRHRGTIGSGPASGRTLAGGVSNIVIEVTQGHRRLVVKQSLERLNVAEEWLAPRRRILTEAAALQQARLLTPYAVPEVLDTDPDRMTLTLAAAPEGWHDWKQDLLAGSADPAVGERLASALAAWHTATRHVRLPAAVEDDPEAFEALRLDPYHEAAARCFPDYAALIRGAAQRLRGRRTCLVHGDFSPKNVLLGPGGVWVIDFEVAHRGNPVFDLAFLLTHLVMKSAYRPAARQRYGAVADRFLGAYVDGAGAELTPEPAELAAQVGALLLARVGGKSPAEYLDDEQRQAVSGTGARLLTGLTASVLDVFDPAEGPPA